MCFVVWEQTASTSGDYTGTGNEEHLLLDEEAYLSDVLHSFRAHNDDNVERCLLLKKRIFRAADDSKTNHRFIELCYLQVLLRCMYALVCKSLNIIWWRCTQIVHMVARCGVKKDRSKCESAPDPKSTL